MFISPFHQHNLVNLPIIPTFRDIANLIERMAMFYFMAYQFIQEFIQDPLDYFRTYHTTMDTYERLSLNDLKVNAAIVVWLAYCAAMDNNRIPVKPGYPEAAIK